MSKKIFMLVFILSLLTAFALPVWAAEGLVTADGNQSQPALSEGLLVWQDTLGSNSRIKYLKDGQIKELPAKGNVGKPAVYGDYIVYNSDRYTKNDIYLYNIVNGQEKRLTSAGAEQQNPAIYGDWVVWEDNRNGNWDIYGYNIANGKEKRLTGDQGNQRFPGIYEQTVVFQDDRNKNWDIYLYNLATSEEKAVISIDGDQVAPDIYGSKIVWADNRAKNWDIYFLDTSDNLEKSIITIDRDQMEPKIYGDTIVWTDYRNQNGDIYGYDLQKNKKIKIYTGDGNQLSPQIRQNRVVWVDDTAKNLDIYGLSLVPVVEVYDPQGIKVLVNGSMLSFDQQPVMEKGRVLVPFRKIAEALGAAVSWNDQLRLVLVNKGDSIISLPVGLPQALVNDRQVKLDVPARVVNGRTLVPVRFISESLKAAVAWDDQTKTVNISY